jgi:ABC-2 type transport system ATP-binding protein
VNVIETDCLGKRYGKSWALLDCSLAVPEGVMAALVGPNGAGKSTLMNMAAGLTIATAGTVTVLGGKHVGSPAALDDIAFMAQDAPVYRNLSVADMLHLTRNLNRRFDEPAARNRLADLGIPLNKNLASFPAASRRSSRSPSRSLGGRGCSSSTSPCPRSTRSPGRTS